LKTLIKDIDSLDLFINLNKKCLHRLICIRK